MDIGIKIRNLRKAKDITQEALADMLKVSTQAVSRWENGSSCPDIMLLPVLANIFSVSIDELFGIDILKNKEKIQNIVKEDKELAQNHATEERIRLLEQALKDFPNSYEIMARKADAYFTRMLEYGSGEAMYQERQQAKKDVVEISEKIMAGCTDDSIRQATISILCNTYPRMGKEGQEKALVLAENLSSILISKERMLLSILDGEDKKKHVQTFLIGLLHLMNDAFTNRTWEFFSDPKQIIEVCERNIMVYKAFLGDEYLNFNSKIAWLYINIAECYYELNEDDKVFENLEKAFLLFDKYETQNIDCYSVFWLDRIHPNKYPASADHSSYYYFISILEGKDFKKYDQDSRYQAILQKAKSRLQELS